MTSLIPIYYINLASRTDRREHMENELARLGLSAERVEAVTRQELSPASGALVPSSYTASRLSHMRAWQLMLDRGAPAAIILEDDVVLHPSFQDFLAPDVLELGADLIKLETFRRTVLLGDRSHHVGEQSTVVELQSSHLGAAAYLMSAGMARRALQEPTLASLHTDRFLFGRGGPNLLRRRVFQADPAPCIQLMMLEGAASALGRGDLAVPSPAKARYRDPIGYSLRVGTIHLWRLLRLALRDPAAMIRRRHKVRFAGSGE
jgi:glycosyl transferase, family 25